MIILDYETTETVYSGENSTIYRARSIDAASTVILKVLKGDHPSTKRLDRFRREFDTASRIQSPKVLRFFRQEPWINTLVSVVEDFGAESLDNRLRQGPVLLRESLTTAIGICQSLSAIHDAGYIHNDINPANVLCNRPALRAFGKKGSGTVAGTAQRVLRTTVPDPFFPNALIIKLAGFSLSLPLGRILAAPQASGVLEGSLPYMSPEQTGRMNRPVDCRSDLYSLGVTLYELFTGHRPFASDDPLELIHCHIARRPVPPGSRSSATPEPLSDIVLKLMEKSAEDRYQSIEGVTADLMECSRQLDTYGSISPFPRARRDVSSRFQLSTKLYGRERDVVTLSRAFERVVGGAMELTLVSGQSGVGKSTLVQELYRPLAVARGRYITGKYDQYQRGVPYSALSNALNSFCDQLLCESPDAVQTWRQRIMSVVGRNGRMLIEVIPRLEHVIGPQPPLPEREPQATMNLLTQLCQDFVQVICRPEEPLVLFLDDLQWADLASLSLLQTLLASPHLRGLHLVGAYRDNEVDASHPLVLMLNELSSAGRSSATIHLDHLSHANVATLIADTLSQSVTDISALADIVFSKTHGNAFFTIEFFKALHA